MILPILYVSSNTNILFVCLGFFFQRKDLTNLSYLSVYPIKMLDFPFNNTQHTLRGKSVPLSKSALIVKELH